MVDGSDRWCAGFCSCRCGEKNRLRWGRYSVIACLGQCAERKVTCIYTIPVPKTWCDILGTVTVEGKKPSGHCTAPRTDAACVPRPAPPATATGTLLDLRSGRGHDLAIANYWPLGDPAACCVGRVVGQATQGFELHCAPDQLEISWIRVSSVKDNLAGACMRR